MYSKTEQEIMKNWKSFLEKPIVSICCVTYNHEHYIADAIDGFLMQETDFPFEILIRDDCSTDGTARIVKHYEDNYPHIIKAVFEKENTFSQGIKPLPQLLKVTKGKYIALCDGDDYWSDPDKLKKQIDFLENNPDYIITFSSIQAHNENGLVANHIEGATRDLTALELQQGVGLNTSTVCFRNIIGHLPAEMYVAPIGDFFLWSLLGEHGKGKYLKEISPNVYRIHNNGVYSKTNAIQRLKIISKLNMSLYLYYDRIGNEKLSHFYRKNIFKSLFEQSSTAELILFLINQAKIHIYNKMKNLKGQ